MSFSKNKFSRDEEFDDIITQIKEFSPVHRYTTGWKKENLIRNGKIKETMREYGFEQNCTEVYADLEDVNLQAIQSLKLVGCHKIANNLYGKH